jgi:hypothetical protein
MKFTKILALTLALACALTLLVSCDLAALEELINSGKTPETPMEYYEYANAYRATHPYKETSVTTTTLNGEIYGDANSVSVTYMDGINYYMEEDGMKITFCDGIYYVETASDKKKMDMDGYLGSLKEDDFGDVESWLSEDSLKLTKNPDGTAILEFAQNIPGVGTYNYVITLDSENRIVKQVLTNEMTMMNYEMITRIESTIEYGDQYKVTPPEDADSYRTVDSIYDIVS